MKKNEYKLGFTLTELLITISILWILSGISYFSYQWYIWNARDSKRMSDISVLKSAAIIYQKSHDWVFPNNISTSYWFIFSWSLANKVASQWSASENFTARIGLSQRIFDPSSNFPYIYAVSADRRQFQFSATLEASNKLASYDNPLIDKACASWDCDKLVAYVDGNFIPSNIHALPSLTYAFNYGKTNLDISDSNNLAKAVLNSQSINIAYDYNNEPLTCSWDIFSVSVWTNSWQIQDWIPCLNSVWDYIPHGTNEVSNLPWTSLGTQMWWKYKVCNNWVLEKNWVNATTDSDYYYSCKDLWFWAQFDETCHWLWCSTWYSVNSSTPWCIEEMWWVTLASPQNWAYWIPTNWFVSWYPAKNFDTSGSYKVYLGTANNTFEVINWSSTINTSVAFSSLLTSKMYFWKVQACDSLWSCKDSPTYSFTTSSDWSSSSSSSGGSWWTSTTSTTSTYCPAWVICRADELVISYIWCNPWDSSYSDCRKDNFWTSERDGNYYYWKTKTLWYKLANNSDWIAKFKIQLWWTGTLVEKWSSNDYDDTTAIDLWGDNLSQNLFWKAWAGCLWDASSGYYVSPKSACYINMYFRWDPFVTFTNDLIAKMKVINNDTINSDWPDTTIPFNGNASWYTTWVPIVVTTLATKYKQAWEPTASTITQNDFDESTIMSWSSFGYWKALTFNIANPNAFDSYFKPYFLDKLWNKFVVDTVNSSAWTNADFSWSGKSIDLLNNWVGNFYRNNWDFTLASPCGTYNRLMKVGWWSSCKITVFYRSDRAIPTKRSNFIDFKLFYQPIADQSVITPVSLYTKKSWWSTTLFTWFYPYSFNWWWTDFSTFSVQEDLDPKWFIRSKTMWWIDMSWSQSGSTIEIYFDWTKKRVKWKTYSQTAWWIDFNKTNNDSVQTYIDNIWKLHWWSRSDNYWWISFDDWINQ